MKEKTKTCPRCKRTLFVSEFSKDVSRRDKLQWQCKTCGRRNYKCELIEEERKKKRAQDIQQTREQMRCKMQQKLTDLGLT